MLLLNVNKVPHGACHNPMCFTSSTAAGLRLVRQEFLSPRGTTMLGAIPVASTGDELPRCFYQTARKVLLRDGSVCLAR